MVKEMRRQSTVLYFCRDLMDNQEVVDFINVRVRGYMPLQCICEALILQCGQPFFQAGKEENQDNMTVLVGVFK